MKKQKKNKLLVILGPTASGKTALSIKLAKKFGGEIISADSRQVYRGLDIGSGKITKKETRGIPHHLLDVANPKKRFSVAQFQKLAKRIIKKILAKNKLPVLVGGTGFYIQSIVDNIILPEVKPNWALRKKLENKTTEELFAMLKKLDPVRAKNIDKHNPRRLLRAIEIIITTKQPILKIERGPTSLEILQIGIKKDRKELAYLIKNRLLRRLKNNAMIKEVKKLHGQGLSWKRLEEFGLEYRYVAQYLQGGLNYQEMINKIQKESEHFVKRQMTWFGRDKRIKWIKNYKEAENIIKKFLLSKKITR
jgi:tRNA dimethylallyltransferase